MSALEEWEKYSQDTMCIPAYELTDPELGERYAIEQARRTIAELLDALELRDKMLDEAWGRRWSPCAASMGHDQFLADLRKRVERVT